MASLSATAEGGRRVGVCMRACAFATRPSPRRSPARCMRSNATRHSAAVVRALICAPASVRRSRMQKPRSRSSSSASLRPRGSL
eukprot:5903663-Prymnesium_polylepis.1